MDDSGNIRSLSREQGKMSEEPAFSLNLHAAWRSGPPLDEEHLMSGVR